MNRALALLVVLAAAGVAACNPLHLGYDFGRAFVETMRVQADLTRPSVQYAGYSLYGTEAVDIRLGVEKASTDTEKVPSQIGSVGGGGGGGGQ